VSIRDEWIVLDTNVWIFGLRRIPDFPACAELLRKPEPAASCTTAADPTRVASKSCRRRAEGSIPTYQPSSDTS
jgi:hypothetical protein